MPASEPRPRRGGLCARPGCKNKALVDIRIATGITVSDPFCSTQCSKVYWGVITEEERAQAADHAERSKAHKAKPIKKTKK